MEAHYQLNDDEFDKSFSKCTLNPAIFSHEAHLRLAWIKIQRSGLDPAEKEIQKQLQNFVTQIGAKDKYNETVTIVAMKVMDHFMQKSEADSFQDFIKEYPQLKTNFKGLIGNHYSYDIFKSDTAKKDYIAPDLEGFE